MTEQPKTLMARIRDWFGGGAKPGTALQRFRGGKISRQNADWITQPVSVNRQLRDRGRTLRARAREAAHDDPYLSRYLELTRSNVIGQKGIQLQSRAMNLAGKLDLKVNQQVETAWWLWGHAETCTASGKLDWKGVQDLVATQMECDGEALVQMIKADNDFGFALKVINVDYLDELYNDVHNGNRVIMSVEVDNNDKPVAYWLTTPASEVMFAPHQERRRVRIPAEEMIHIFEAQDDEAQVRGVTAFKAVLLTAKNLLSYQQGVINSCRMQSNVVGFLEQDTPDENAPYTGSEDPLTGAAVPTTIDMAPFSMNELPAGYKLKQLDPNQPTQNHTAFVKSILMEMAAGLGVPYFLLANDWEATNFSSSRGGLDAARDMWRKKSEFIANTLCRRVFHAWAKSAMLNKQLALTPRQFAEIQNPKWNTRGWKYIDPTKDVDAAMVAIAGGLSSYKRELSEMGVDFTDFLAERKSEMDEMKAAGVILTPVTAIKVTDTGTAPAEDSGPPPKTKEAAA